MASATMDNVFSLAGAQARRRNVKPESVGVINDCRDIALKRIVALLSSTFDTIEDELFEMAEKSPDRDSQNLYLDARAQAREKRTSIEAAFKKQFLSFFERKVAGASQGDLDRDKGAVDFASLSLVDDDELEQHLAMNDLAKRLNSKCDSELRGLSQRMGFLLQEPDLDDSANPIAPDTIVRALQAACNQMTAGFQTKLTVMRLVEQHMASEMLSVYRDINSHLVSRNVMPNLPMGFRKSSPNDGRKSVTGGLGQALQPGAAAATEGADAKRHAPAAGDLFATLQQLLSGISVGDASSVSAAGEHFASPLSMSANQGEASIATSGLVTALTKIQQQLQSDSTVLSAMRNVQNFVPGESPLADLNVLHQVKARGLTSPSNQVDTMTIDIVAMLFDYVFEDKAVPDIIKALIARLQIPVLKVAIIDRSFFSVKAHPARRLLDVMADASVCIGGQASKEDPLYLKIEEVVERIHREFDTDIGLFDAMLADMEGFLKSRENAGAELVEQSARAVHESERREMARLVSVDEIERRVEGIDLPVAVGAMLRGPWARVLERIYLRENGRELQFVNALETADDLIWSVTPKLNADERKRLVALLPTLLKRLQDGMNIAAVEQQDRSRFFSALVDCHAAAVRAGLRGESVSSLLAGSHSLAETSPLFEKLFDEERSRDDAERILSRSGVARIHFTERGVEIEDVALPESAPQPGSASELSEHNDGLDFNVAAGPVPELKRGTWVEFSQEGGRKIRAKLTWISPLKGVYLFTNPGASEALSVLPEVLRAQFQRGDARLIDGTSIVDRAVDHMVQSLAHATS